MYWMSVNFYETTRNNIPDDCHILDGVIYQFWVLHKQKLVAFG
jgi:hypothetical protein